MVQVKYQHKGISNKKNTKDIDPDNRGPDDFRIAIDTVYNYADGGVFNLLRRGHMTTQVNCDLYEGGVPPDGYTGPYAIYPAEWFVVAKFRRPSLGKEDGFTFWTRKGWNANIDVIKQIWNENEPGINRCLLPELLAHAEQEFDMRDANLSAHISNLEKKLAQAKIIEV